MIWIGTSGFQYPEWKGSFYPDALSPDGMLRFYGEHFPTTEINYSFYRVPSVKTLTRWSEDTPEHFRFSFKAPREITHVRRLRAAGDVLRRFCEAIRAIDPKFGVVLFQLPPFQKKDIPLLADFLQSLPGGLKTAFEFRHTSWFADEVFDCLKGQDAALCVAETERLTTPTVITARHGYFRLRRPDYTDTDLVRWAGVIGAQDDQLEAVYVYFKHEESGVGPALALRLQSALGARTAV